MRIAFLSAFYPFRGGIAQFNALLYKTLEKQGHTTKAYTFTCQYPSLLFPGKTQYVSPKDNAIPIDSKPVLSSINPFSYEKTAREILQWKPDILVIRYWMSFLAPSLAYVANRLKKKGIKIICIVDNALPHEPRFFDRAFARLLFNQVDRFIVMSNAVKNDLLSLKPNAEICLKPHPLYNHFGEKLPQLEAQKQLGLNPEKQTLLFFGLIRDYKGLDLLIDAFSLLDDSFQLIIAGESYGSFDKYRNQIDASGKKDRITIINRYIDDKEVPVLFSAADILVLPYKSATQSGIIPVAYHFEVPSVATDVGGLKETLERPGTGVVCKPDAESLAEGILQIYSIGKETFVSNIKKEKETLSWEEFAQTLIKFSGSSF
ncbi:MAG: glycosyltransferase [Dysgonamonadaceae bacterium]|jgi:glycosyltransferase involved in cell wall biosynthesis|nr:glycosyltransferase [Dysgonamonadaceae bacterium]